MAHNSNYLVFIIVKVSMKIRVIVWRLKNISGGRVRRGSECCNKWAYCAYFSIHNVITLFFMRQRKRGERRGRRMVSAIHILG
jgi:hypothetical protein